MATIVIPEVHEDIISQLEQRAAAHGRTPEAEAKVILETTLQPVQSIWGEVNAFRRQLAASNRCFGDSTELLREDRER